MEIFFAIFWNKYFLPEGGEKLSFDRKAFLFLIQHVIWSELFQMSDDIEKQPNISQCSKSKHSSSHTKGQAGVEIASPL